MLFTHLVDAFLKKYMWNKPDTEDKYMIPPIRGT